MGRLQETQSGQTCYLEPETLIGRSRSSTLLLDHPLVSSQHAVLRWTGSAWELRDLASRNGTRVDGSQVAGAPRLLERGAVLTFGSEENCWTLDDDGEPQSMLVPLAGGAPVVIDRELVALPSADEPAVTIFRDSAGQWLMEATDEVVLPLAHGQRVEVAGQAWRFSVPSPVARTTASDAESGAREPTLHFAVTRDEEHVELRAVVGDREIDLGSSGRYYLLLTLARQRLADRRDRVPETSCGWMYHEHLVKALCVTAQQLNLDVFRIRKQLAEKHVPSAATVIERRPRTRQLRIGIAQFTIRTL